MKIELLLLISIGINLLTFIRIEMLKDDTRTIITGITNTLALLIDIGHKEKIITDKEYEDIKNIIL